ncbi:MAG TPA: tRNA (guanosine(46)-N7)-methyltransferase TrmB [Acidiferrobacteraceae bacterium]|nr:tRNA (guanosine(46)-N7)-methyltransferase TrmB [Acidiferrobacteraceae bacterium]HEX19412.1 tRNA (guanosine(46)-N7)-methyltransferase TrmB [Acidiferrobacteraceae bacterium]
MNKAPTIPRLVRSFVRRGGRLTPAQQRALDELWPEFGIASIEQPVNFHTLFSRTAPVILDIGFGNGSALAAMARAMPDRDFLGVDVYRPGIGQLLLQLQRLGLDNVRVVNADVNDLLQTGIADHSLNGVNIFFPDPWPKKRHHKRRLIQPPFVQRLVNKLRPGAGLHLATDWQDYAEQMMAVLSEHPQLENTEGRGQFAPRPEYRPLTKFERRGLNLDHGVWDLLFTCRA